SKEISKFSESFCRSEVLTSSVGIVIKLPRQLVLNADLLLDEGKVVIYFDHSAGPSNVGGEDGIRTRGTGVLAPVRRLRRSVLSATQPPLRATHSAPQPSHLYRPLSHL